MVGVVVATFPARGYGFVRPIHSHDKADNVFVLFRDVCRHPQHKARNCYLLVGERVEYEQVPSEPLPQGVNVQVQSTRQSVRAQITSCKGSHVSARFLWGKNFLTASVKKADIAGCANRTAARLEPGDEIIGIAYSTVDDRVKLGFCVIPSS